MDLARGGAPCGTAGPAIGVMRGGALGDFVLTLPAIGVLRRSFPGHALRLVGRPEYLRLARPEQLLDHDSARLAPLYVRQAGLSAPVRAFFADLRFLLAYAVDPEQVLAAQLAALVPGEVIVHDPQPPAGYQGHIGEHLLVPLRRRGLPEPEPPPSLRLLPEERSWAASCWRDLGLGPAPVLLHPGSGGPRKCWPPSSYAALAERLQRQGAQVLLVLGPVEAERPAPPAPCPVLRPPGAIELASLLERASLFVGNDSGPGHLAAALGRPTLSLFGPTDPQVWRPLGPCCRVLRAPDGQMAALPVDAVLEAAEAMLALDRDPPAPA